MKRFLCKCLSRLFLCLGKGFDWLSDLAYMLHEGLEPKD
jgi:hypothetical protein